MQPHASIMQRDPFRPSHPRASLPELYPLAVARTEHPGRTFHGELAPAEAAYVLKAHTAAWAWCRHGPAVLGATRPHGLVDELAAAPLPRDLLLALVLLARELESRRLDPHRLALACMAVGDCAIARDARQTALLWNETAAMAVSANPRFSWIAGKLHRNWDSCRDAEFWLRRAERMAVRIDDRYTQALALNSLGNLYLQTGNYVLAKEALYRALMRARRHGLRSLHAAILHDLSLLSTAMERFKDAERYGAAAFEKYGPGHPNLPKLAHDLAQIWAYQGFFARALDVCHAVLPLFEIPEERLRVLASLIRCAGGSGEKHLVEQHWNEAWVIASGDVAECVRAPALVDMGRGAANVADWERANSALEWARRSATSSKQMDVLARAESALESVRNHARAEQSPKHTRDSAAAEQLAQKLKARVRPEAL